MAALVVVLGIAALPAAWAGGLRGAAPEAASEARERVLRDGVSMDEAIDRAQRRYRARVVRAERSESGGRVVYVLRLLSDEDGRVFTVRVDAQTGAMQ